jgi:fucose 4-O-acetylase-like acetyltransferase
MKVRISWIDNAKFIAILCVVIGHAFSLINGFRGYDEINLFIVIFNMPLFALLSGITSYKITLENFAII